jgi:4'-phosphopantetheinyl transferase
VGTLDGRLRSTAALRPQAVGVRCDERLGKGERDACSDRLAARLPAVFAGDADIEARVNDLHGWSEHASAAFAARMMPGDHSFVHSARARLSGSIAADPANGQVCTARIAEPGLEIGEVHVWHAGTDELALCDAALRTSLSPEERERADRFRFRGDRSRFVRRRWLLRRLLAAYGADPGTATFATGPNGKPSAPAGSSLRFNASSSDGLAVVALARDRDVGVDVERSRPVPDRERLLRSTMTAEEQARLATQGGGGQDAAFLRLWTVKEALMKALGAGLSLEPREVVSTPRGPGRWAVSSGRGAAPWTAVAVDVGPSHIASLAVPEGAQPRVRTIAFTPGRLS